MQGKRDFWTLSLWINFDSLKKFNSQRILIEGSAKEVNFRINDIDLLARVVINEGTEVTSAPVGGISVWINSN
jgi:hypothetical protein